MSSAAMRGSITVSGGVFILGLLGCSPEYRDSGQYRVLDVDDNFLGLICQTRQEFYFLRRSSEGVDPVYLGTCGSPGFITDSVHMPGDPSCFSISKNGKSIVYLHRPEICGADQKATGKPGGVYIHSALAGDRLIYPRSQVEQEWGGEVLDSGALRVSWRADTPSRTGAKCGQSIVIHADGLEEVLGQPISVLCFGTVTPNNVLEQTRGQ